MTKHIKLSWNDDPDEPMTPAEQAVMLASGIVCAIILALQVYFVMLVH